MLSEENKKLLYIFFKENKDFLMNNNTYIVENLEIFIERYEKYLEDNNLKENYVLLQFLLELKSELLHRKGNISMSERMKEKALSVIPNTFVAPSVIHKWYIALSTVNEEYNKTTVYEFNNVQRNKIDPYANDYDIKKDYKVKR